MATYRFPVDAQLLQDYLERRLPEREERALEEAIVGDPALAEQVRLEMLMREGTRELARRDAKVPGPSSSRAPTQAPAVPVSVRPRALPRWLPYAAAAVLVLGLALPIADRVRDAGSPLGAPAGVPAIAEVELDPRVEPALSLAAYALPEPATNAAPEAGPSSLRLRLPRQAQEIVLELPEGSGAQPRRLLLTRPDRPEISLVLPASALREDGHGFTLATTQLPPGRYDAEIERQGEGGWVSERRFTLRVDADAR